VVVDPADYDELLETLKSGSDGLAFRKRLAWKAYQHTASYDAQVGGDWGGVGWSGVACVVEGMMPQVCSALRGSRQRQRARGAMP
jgi:hypothetical protein